MGHHMAFLVLCYLSDKIILAKKNTNCDIYQHIKEKEKLEAYICLEFCNFNNLEYTMVQ